jgi:tRNA pseudouridine32 synthase/23S rRNA pseudouridine746 synthase
MKNFGCELFHPLVLNQKAELPKAFTFPFYYTPHTLSVMAAKQLQSYLECQTDFEHNFGLDSTQTGLQIGKMFGVMVVEDKAKQLGYLAAFSGKLGESNFVNGFVPTVFDTLQPEGFYKIGEARLNVLNGEIEALENSSDLAKANSALETCIAQSEADLKAFKAKIKAQKKVRNAQRAEAKANLTAVEFDALDQDLKKQSIYYHYRLKDLKKAGDASIAKAKLKLEALLNPIKLLKTERATLSASLQNRLHQQYRFLNAKGVTKDLLAIFKDTVTPTPPAGSGECAAPKLFQYAYSD